MPSDPLASILGALEALRRSDNGETYLAPAWRHNLITGNLDRCLERRSVRFRELDALIAAEDAARNPGAEMRRKLSHSALIRAKVLKGLEGHWERQQERIERRRAGNLKRSLSMSSIWRQRRRPLEPRDIYDNRTPETRVEIRRAHDAST